MGIIKDTALIEYPSFPTGLVVAGSVTHTEGAEIVECGMRIRRHVALPDIFKYLGTLELCHFQVRRHTQSLTNVLKHHLDRHDPFTRL